MTITEFVNQAIENSDKNFGKLNWENIGRLTMAEIRWCVYNLLLPFAPSQEYDLKEVSEYLYKKAALKAMRK